MFQVNDRREEAKLFFASPVKTFIASLELCLGRTALSKNSLYIAIV